MDFSQVRAITIPEGSVNRILSGATVLWEKTGGLPTGYQQVEYIESTGTQYLNIPYTPVENDEFDILATGTSFTVASTLISCGTGTKQFIILLQGGKGFYKYFASGAASEFTAPAANAKVRYTNKGHVEQLVVTNADTGVEISSCYSSYQQAIDGTDKTLYIFKRANGTSPFGGRLYKLTIDNGNTEKLDLVPCYRKSDGVAGLYDMVNNVFYTNAGTGEFTVGPKVFPLPSEYQQVEYIESSGTQYIATNYTPTITENMKIEIDYMFTRSQDGDSFLFGSKLNNPNAPTFQCEYYSHRNWYCGSGIWQFRGVLGGIGSNLNTRYSLVMDGNVLAVGDFTRTSTDTRRNGNAAPMYIFAGNWIGRVQYINKGASIYSLAFTADGIKEAEFVPCYRKSDGEIGMYDLVSATFFTNSGSGTFSKGADIT